jgi:cyclophilin family peptidyl-prolyl cis-trans isomerase
MRIWYFVLLLAGMLLFASACPRDTGSDEAAGGNDGMVSSTSEQAADTTHGEGSADSLDTEEKGHEGHGHAPGEHGDEAMEEDADAAAEGEGEADAAADEEAGMADAGEDDAATPGEDEAEAEGDVVNVILETSKGNITIAVHRDWAPIGAEHFFELVRSGYYDGAPWFRVIPGFMCQTGIAADPEMTAQWQDQTIEDEPVVVGNLPGKVSFGRSRGPNSRSTHFFINYVDNSASLDQQGFPAFGEVVEGMDVARSLFATGENPGYVQQRLGQEGIEFFRTEYPDGDVIVRAWIVE